jgi:NAD(P)-dependent dehydrogenase (short-subunit alcohol dehydrogenase family)
LTWNAASRGSFGAAHDGRFFARVHAPPQSTRPFASSLLWGGIAADHAADGIRANAICPRARTAMPEQVFGPAPENGVDPLSVTHVAPFVTYLASPAAEAPVSDEVKPESRPAGRPADLFFERVTEDDVAEQPRGTKRDRNWQAAHDHGV